MTLPAGPSVEPSPPLARRADVGRTAFGLAMLLLLLLPLGTLLLNSPSLVDQAVPLSALWLVQSSGMILSLLLGLAAVITGRGRGWGAAAMVTSVIGSSYAWILLYSWLGTSG